MDSASGRLHLREIQRRAGTSPGTASRERAKLVAAGLVEREAEGNQVYFRASTSPFATMLRSLLVAMPDPEFKPRPKPVTFRTLDIGGDKALPYMETVVEENPALGWRAIRLGLDRPGLLRGQITAVVGGDGAGKSTLLRALAGVVRSTAGRVRRPPAQRIG